MTWPPEKVEDLRRLWNEGHSGSAIARMLGGFDHCGDGGRSAVIGKVHRLGLPGRVAVSHTKPNRKHAWRAPRTIKAPVSQAIVRDGTPIPAPADTDIPRVRSLDLEDHHCRFPCLPMPAGPFVPQFCGAKRVPGLPYCEPHVRRAYQPPQPRRPAPAAKPETAEDKILEAAA